MIWWLVLVAATLAGAWCLGYRSRWHRFTAQKIGLRRDYLVGLNYILNEEPDKAVDVFIRMLEVDSDTVETHLAVGKLFRRRGEVDRAIRIHQNLIARPQLDKSYRDQSLFELGQDYLSAGVLDRAEQVFLDVVNVKQYAIPALKALRDIYQREKDWNNAIKTAEHMERITRENLHPVIAHYYCELADIEINHQQYDQARHYIDRALNADANCARASLLRAKVEMSAGHYRIALKSLKKIRNQNPDYLSEAVDGLASCYEGLSEEDQMVQYFMKLLEEYPRVPVVLILSERIRKQKGDSTAAKYVADYVRRYPSLRGLHLFINLYMSSVEGRAREDMMILQKLMQKLLADKPDYKCVSCGFSCNSLHWLCPGCRQWSTIKPLYCLEN
ncbi:MAG: lipopolysaccharide assembly protein LapB [Gammaproteobacteria bacterium]|nr:lipopolysaccharide assembly protein LapB [Gammaproteobacteria bacterium]